MHFECVYSVMITMSVRKQFTFLKTTHKTLYVCSLRNTNNVALSLAKWFSENNHSVTQFELAVFLGSEFLRTQ